MGIKNYPPDGRLLGGVAGRAPPREGEKREEYVKGERIRATRSVTPDLQAPRATRVSTELTSLP